MNQHWSSQPLWPHGRGSNMVQSGHWTWPWLETYWLSALCMWVICATEITNRSADPIEKTFRASTLQKWSAKFPNMDTHKGLFPKCQDYCCWSTFADHASLHLSTSLPKQLHEISNCKVSFDLLHGVLASVIPKCQYYSYTSTSLYKWLCSQPRYKGEMEVSSAFT